LAGAPGLTAYAAETGASGVTARSGVRIGQLVALERDETTHAREQRTHQEQAREPPPAHAHADA